MPVLGALVQLEPAAGASIYVLTDSGGTFKIAVPTGAIRVRVEMIGYASWLSERRVGPQDTVRMHVQLDVQAIALEGIAVETPRRCSGITSGSSPLTDALWRNVRTALGAAQALTGYEPVEFLVERYERQVALDSLVVLSEDRRRGRSTAREGFRSVPIAQLEATGFLSPGERHTELLGPTGEIMLDPWFTNTHCMRVLMNRANPGLIGIWFAPNELRRVPEIRGVMWLDSASLDLRRIEFEYVNLSGAIAAASHTGEQEFTRLTDGGVIMQRWVIRAPLIEPLNRTTVRIAGFEESGGEVLRARRGSAVILDVERGVIEGIVRSSRGITMGGARVALNGTPYETRTDSAGYFRLMDVPAGTYHVVVDHQEGAAPRRILVRVTHGQHVRVDFSINQPSHEFR
jgi:hypothetical protein